MRVKEEKGVAMVEATIYMPIVLCVVMSLIYLALFNMQEYMLLYEAQRVAAVAAREDAYIGYEKFGMGEDNEIDFPANADITSASKVNSYLEAHNTDMGALYRGFGKVFGKGTASKQAQKVAGTVEESTLIALNTGIHTDIDVHSGLLGTSVNVTIRHQLPMPGVMAYLGYDGSTTLRATAYTFSVNPSEFVRNVDLADDMVEYVFGKLGLDYGKFKEKTGAVLDKLF